MAMYDRQIATAKRLIKKYGVSTAVTYKTIATDPDKPWQTVETEITETVPVCFLTLDAGSMKTLSMAPGTEVPVGAVLAYMGAVGFKVDLTTTFQYDGKVWSMFWVDKLAPNGRPILYTMVLGG